MIGVYNHLLSKVFRFHYHSQKVIGSLGSGFYSHRDLSSGSWGWSRITTFSSGLVVETNTTTKVRVGKGCGVEVKRVFVLSFFSHTPYQPCMVYLPTWMVYFYGKCREIYHTWIVWILYLVGVNVFDNIFVKLDDFPRLGFPKFNTFFSRPSIFGGQDVGVATNYSSPKWITQQ